MIYCLCCQFIIYNDSCSVWVIIRLIFITCSGHLRCIIYIHYITNFSESNYMYNQKHFLTYLLFLKKQVELAWCSGSIMDCHMTAWGFDSLWERCKNWASRPSQGTLNGDAVSKWPRCRWDVKQNQPTWKADFLKLKIASFIHFQSHSISECDSSNHLVSSLLSSSFFVFWLLLSNRCTALLQILCGCSLGGPLLSLLKSGCYFYFSWTYG